MTSIDVLTFITLLVVGWAMIYTFRDIKVAPIPKKLLRIFDFILFFYLSVVYILVLTMDSYLLRSGILLRFGMIVVVVLFILEIYTNRQGG